MKWYEITVTTDTEGAELVSDAFFSIGCLGGVKIIDRNDVLDIIKNQTMWDYIDENLLRESRTVKVSGYVSEDELTEKTWELRAVLTDYGIPSDELIVTEVDDESWYDNWRRYYAPIPCGNYIIVPKWLQCEEKGKTVILMDPGMAFGTGEHESTKLCLKFMSEYTFTEKSVIDVGTGSGILGIAAAKSGAKSVYMCDIDSVAIKAAKENAALNNVLEQVTIELADLLTKSDRMGDILLANLTADILIRLSTGLGGVINTGGILISSGIIVPRKQEVIAAFSAAGLTLYREETMGEWVALSFVK